MLTLTVSTASVTGNDGDWAHSDSAHTLTVGTDYVAEITRGNIGAGADEAFVDYDNPTITEEAITFNTRIKR